VLASPERKRVIYAELKTDKGKVRPEQQEWLDTMADCGQEVYVWRPGDFEQIVEILR